MLKSPLTSVLKKKSCWNQKLCLSQLKQAILEEVAEVEAQKELIKSKIKKFEGCDPEVLEKIEGDAKMAKEAINRWTDNIFAGK